MTVITTEISQAVTTLNQGKVIAIPTETVYGLAANIYDDKAINAIFEIKKRPNNNPLIVHIKSVEQLKEVARTIPTVAQKLAQHFWPGPLTLVLPKQKTISDFISAGKDTVAVRVPNHPVILDLLENLNYPLAAPSANPFGSISPTNTTHVLDYFDTKIDLILEGGSCVNGIESTIVGFENNEVVLYRHGAIAIEDIEKISGALKIATNDNKTPIAPGMFSRHYAPKTKSFLVEDVEKEIKFFAAQKIGVLQFQHKIESSTITTQYILSPSGNYQEASQNLYAYLHELDSLQLDVLLIQKLPNFNLGKSINDRLSRAVATI